ncbi:MAG: excinuclease ABC subunit A, partial [Leuconostoc mesenteroides]
ALFEQLDLLQPIKKQLNETKIDQVVDDIRRKFGLTSLVKLSSSGDGGTMIDRAGLVGGHNGGNAFG